MLTIGDHFPNLSFPVWSNHGMTVIESATLIGRWCILHFPHLPYSREQIWRREPSVPDASIVEGLVLEPTDNFFFYPRPDSAHASSTPIIVDLFGQIHRLFGLEAGISRPRWRSYLINPEGILAYSITHSCIHERIATFLYTLLTSADPQRRSWTFALSANGSREDDHKLRLGGAA
jgi:hypothetical protein